MYKSFLRELRRRLVRSRRGREKKKSRTFKGDEKRVSGLFFDCNIGISSDAV